MGLTQAISLNICAHFEPITCYQDHTQNVKDSLHYFGDAIPDCSVREAQHFENGEVHYRTIAEIEIGRISPLDVRGMRAAQQQQQPPPSAEQQPQAAADPPAPQSLPAQASPLRRRRRRIREHPYRPPAIIPVPLRDMTPPPSPAILPVPRPSRQRQTARMSTSQLPRILHQ